jgi:HK97 family phage major capsid protein
VLTKANTKYKRAVANVVWTMSQYVFGKLLSLKTTDGNPLYPEMRNFQNPYLLGYKILLSDKAPVQDSTADLPSTKVLSLGDYSYFLIAKRRGMTVEQGYYGDNWKN